MVPRPSETEANRRSHRGPQRSNRRGRTPPSRCATDLDRFATRRGGTTPRPIRGELQSGFRRTKQPSVGPEPRSPTYKGGQINTAPDMSFGRLAGKEIGVHCVAIRPSSSSNLTALVATRQSRLPRNSLHLAVHCRSCCNGRLRPRSPCRAETRRGAVDGTDVVFHVAALVDAWVRDPRDYVRVNVEGTRHVADEALRASVPRFVFTSSLSGIGVTQGAVMREDSPPGKTFGPYEESKAEAERLVARAVRERGLPAITIIPSIVIGPGDTRNTGKFLLAYVNGEFPGTFAETSVLPVVDVDDVARAHLLAYYRGRVGERYIVSGQNVAWGELLRIASAASGTPMPSRHLGGRAVWLASRTGELLSRITRAPPRLPPWLADFLLAGASMENGKSVRDLGMTYRPIAESIRESIV